MKHQMPVVEPSQSFSEAIYNKVKEKKINCTNHIQRRKRASLKRTRPIDAVLLDFDLFIKK